MRDRLPTPGKENRVKITMDDGSVVEGVLSYADDATQEGSAYTKGNVLPDSVLSLIGLSTESSEPADMFNVLATVGDLHVWRRTTSSGTDYPVSVNPNAYQTGSDGQPAGYTLDKKTGNFQLSPNVQVDKGKTNIHYSSSLVGNAFYADRYETVTGYPAIPAVTTIEYLGKLGDKARMQIVSYVGTGTYGVSNPCSITADFPIDVAILLGLENMAAPTNPWGTMFSENCAIIGETLTESYTKSYGFSNMINRTTSYAKKSQDGKTVSWYNTDNGGQFNSPDTKYYVLCVQL